MPAVVHCSAWDTVVFRRVFPHPDGDQPDEVSSLRRRASDWYGGTGLPSGAVRQVLDVYAPFVVGYRSTA
jgi:hypothetical protein